jgi:sec-independent protein translocase protein TatC
MPLDQIDVDKIEAPEKEAEMTFLEHLEELRWHIVRSIAAIVIFGIIIFLAKDFVFDQIIFAPKYKEFFSYQIMCRFYEWIGMGTQLCLTPPAFDVIATEFGERFVVHIKVSVILGFIISFPYIFWEVWRFIKPGLYQEEQKAARGVVFICSALFLMGVLFGYYIISPFAVTFLAGYDIADVKSTT